MAGPSPTEQGHLGNFTVESRRGIPIEVWDRNGPGQPAADAAVVNRIGRVVSAAQRLPSARRGPPGRSFSA
jgi:hypothetical protein